MFPSARNRVREEERTVPAAKTVRPARPKRPKKLTGIEAVWSATHQRWCWRAKREWTIAGKRVKAVGPHRLTAQTAHDDYLALDTDSAPAPRISGTIGEALDLLRFRDLERGLPERTVSTMVDSNGRCLLRFWPRDVELARIDAASIVRYCKAMVDAERSTSTIRTKDLPLLNRLFRVAGVPSPVPQALEQVGRSLLKVAPPQMAFLSLSEAKDLLTAMRARPVRNRQGHLVDVSDEDATAEADLVQLLLQTGIRAGGELERLTLASIEHGQIRVVGKDRGNPRSIEIDDVLAPVIERFAARARRLAGPTVPRDQVPLFPDSAMFCQHTWRRWRKILGEKRLCGRTLRHTFVTAVLATGGTSLEARELAGHRSLRTTDRYVHALSPHRRERRLAVARELGLVDGAGTDAPAGAPEQTAEPRRAAGP